MSPFFNRQRELAELDAIAAAPGPQFVMVAGRRRVGKTTLLNHWAAKTGLPTFYWYAKQGDSRTLLANLARHVYAWEHGQLQADLEIRPRDWEEALDMLAHAVGERPAIVILDELPYLLGADPAFASYLQGAWDHRFSQGAVRLFVSGSHVGMMEDLVAYHAPLYGRFTAQLPLAPLRFGDLRHFLPGLDVHKRLAVYAILGGVPAYLQHWQPALSLNANVERLFLQRTGFFRAEPLVLISDLTQRETDTYEAILRAIAAGHHAREDIATYSAIPSTSLSHYLPRLLKLRLVERRLSALVPLERRATSREARYFLADPFLRFHYRFVDPNLSQIEQGLATALWRALEEQFRSFVGDAFEALCREWATTLAQRAASALPFQPEIVGGHGASDVQIDVVAVNWRTRDLLLGEAKWGAGRVGRDVVVELIETKSPKVVPDGGAGWNIHYAFFARDGFTPAAQAEADRHHAVCRTLDQMEREL